MNINATLLGQAIAFFIFVVFCMKYVWPPLMAAIEARQKAIADGLSSAERAKKDLDLAKANATDQLKEAKLQAAMYSRSMFKFSMRISIYLDVIDCIKRII